MKNIEKYKAGNILHGIWVNLLHLKDSFIGWQQHSPFFFPLVIILSILFITAFVIYTLWKLKKYLNQETVLLEITPPAFTEKTAYTTQQLFSVFHDLGYKSNFFNSLLGRKTIFSLEIVSNRIQGIRYIIRSPKEEADILQRDLLSYLPDVKVKEVEEYLPKDLKSAKVIEWKLKNHFAFPLKKQNTLSEHDPVAYITGAMTKLETSELISFQIVLSPTLRRETNILSNKILHNEDILEYITRPHFAWYIQMFYIIFKLLFSLTNKALMEIAWAISEISHGSSKTQPSYSYASYQQNIKVPNVRPARILSSFEQQAVLSIQEKIDQKLFEAKIRALVVINDKSNQKQRIKGLKTSLAPFSVPKYQSFIAKYNFPTFLVDRFRVEMFKNRLLSGFFNRSSCVLSASEIADLYHFPFSRVTQTENIVKSYSKELPAPVSLKQNTEFDVVFAKNTYGGQTTMIGLTPEQRARHMVVFGGTGNGKTTLILEMIGQDMQNGKGISFIDPHGDAAEKALLLVPKDREKDVVYIDPDDIDQPIALNLMELTPGLSENDILREKERIAESIVSLFRRICSSEFSKATNAFRIENILRNTIYTAFTIKDCTLFTIYDLLQDPALLKETVGKLENERLQKFWKNEFGRAGDFQLVKMIGGVTTRIGRFLNSEAARRILEQPHSTINFDEIMNQKKILICNLSKGKLGEDVSQVLGTTIITKIQLAIMRRAKISENSRVPFYLYVDEFQNYATESFVEMLSEARKYKLNIIIVEQSTSQQQGQNLINIILANVAVVICFRTGNPEDEKIMLGQFSPNVKVNEIMNLPWFNFFIKIYSQMPQEPFSGQTIPLEIEFDKAKIERIIKISREKYGVEYKAQKTEIQKETIDTPNTDKTNIIKTGQEIKGNSSQKTKIKSGLPK